MKKILAIGHNYYPELTGIGKYTAEFCNYLVNAGFSVDVITGNPYYPQWKLFEGYKNNRFTKENISGVTVYRTPLFIPENPSGFKRLLQDGFFFIAVLLVVVKLLFRKKKYDCIFIAVPSFLLGLIGLFYRFFSRKTIVLYHIQDLQIDAAENLGMIRSKLLLKLFYGIEKYVLNHANYVSTISEGMREKVLQKSKTLKECILFPNWINNKNIFPINPKPLIDKDGLHNKKIIFYSGAIGEKQGLEMILEVAANFSSDKDFVFVISGEGPYKEKLITQAQEQHLQNIIFFKLLPVEEFNEMLNAAYIHLVIQKESGSDFFLPSKLTNILGIGGCVIVTATENTSLYKIISKNNCGLLVLPSDVEALQRGIEMLDENNNKRELYSNNALQYAHHFLYQKSVIENYMHQTGISALN
jgi:colanic acid biosynthesis glycosyl transferase WcaI